MYKQLKAFINAKIAISEEELAVILPYFKSMSVKKNKLLVSQGEFGQHLFFVEKNCIPNSKVYQNLMIKWEIMHDGDNNFDFIFMTDKDNQMVYINLEDESVPKKLDI